MGRAATLGSCVATLIGVCLGVRAFGQSGAPLKPGATIPLPNVSGRIDHLAFDAGTARLFVAALGNDTVEVVDTTKSVHLRSVAGFHEPQGMAIVPDLRAVAVSNGVTGTLQLIDTQTLQTRWTVDVGRDADNVRYDAVAKRLYVAAEGGLFAIDPSSGRSVGRIGISGHPESFQLESQGSRVYANLPGGLGGLLGGAQVVAADRNKMAKTGQWAACGANYPMALDEAGGRLFIGCRRPASVAILDTASGKVLGTTPAVGDTDDLFYDSDRRRLYVIGGEGRVDVFSRDADTLSRTDSVATRDGARTGLWVAQQRRLYVAVPARSGQSAEIRVVQVPQ